MSPRSTILVPVVVALGLAVVAVAASGGRTNAAAGTSACQFQTAPGTSVALCETFDAPAGTGNRSGQLNGTLWGVSRATGNTAPGQLLNAWTPTQLQACGSTLVVQPENDIRICNGQAVEATNDGQTVTTLAMYPKQPFDIAGRTGTVTFDVSNNSQGSHAAWPEFWYSDQPVPTPFTHESSWIAFPRNGLGVRFAAVCSPGQGANCAPACPNDSHTRFTVDSAVVSRNYVGDDSFNGGSLRVTPLDCVISSPGPGIMNHIELRISQNQVDVYATDAGTIAPLHHIAVIQNANLTLTRGLIWLEDTHYNAGKFNSQRANTFAWDNVGFDGPVLARDLAFDAMDSLTPAGGGTVNLGWGTSPAAPQTLTVNGVNGIANASAALLTFNFTNYSAPVSLSFSVNGNPVHTTAWPFPDTTTYTWRTIALSVPLSELRAGANTVKLYGSDYLVIANVDIVLVGAGGTGSASTAPTATPTKSTTPPPTATPTRSSTSTPAPAKSPTTIPTPTKSPSQPTTWTTAGSSSAQSVRRGASVVISANARTNVTALALLDIEVYSPTGGKVMQQWFDRETFAPGAMRSFSTGWVVPIGASMGTYTVKIGVFSLGWGSLFSWNNRAATFVVTP